jgi:hypothetical protein
MQDCLSANGFSFVARLTRNVKPIAPARQITLSSLNRGKYKILACNVLCFFCSVALPLPMYSRLITIFNQTLIKESRMKRIVNSLVLLGVLGAATVLAHDPPPPDGGHGWNSNLFIQVMRPPMPVLFTTNSPLVFRGVVGPFDKVDKVLYSTSAGDAGECALMVTGMFYRTNMFFTSPPISLVAGSNLITFTAVPLDPAIGSASDHVMVFYNAQGLNQRPIITTLPPRIWGSNEVYSYTLVATDADNDALTLNLKTAGPVLATATALRYGTWQIDAVRTGTNLFPRLRVWFRATVSDGITRPAVQQWPVVLGPVCTNIWSGGGHHTPRLRQTL